MPHIFFKEAEPRLTGNSANTLQPVEECKTDTSGCWNKTEQIMTHKEKDALNTRALDRASRVLKTGQSPHWWQPVHRGGWQKGNALVWWDLTAVVIKIMNLYRYENA